MSGHAAITRPRILSVPLRLLSFPVVVLVASCGGGQIPPPASTVVVPTSAASPPGSSPSVTVTLPPGQTSQPTPNVGPEPDETSGSRRVIVTLSVPFIPGGNPPSPEEERRQREAIAAAQDGLLADLSPFAVRVLVRFNGPQLSLLVDDEALAHLRSSPRVVAVQEDVPKPPS